MKQDKSLEPIKTKLTVLIDTAEQHPFEFANLRGDYAQGYRPLIIPRRFVSLGRYPNSLGDYSVEGYMGKIGIERKSVSDLQGTVLGWELTNDNQELIDEGRRHRFEQELENLSKITYGMVVVEGNYQDCLDTMQQWGKKTAKENAKIFNRSIQAFMMDYKGVQWMFASSREIAEAYVYQTLRRFVRKQKELHKNVDPKRQ